MSEIFIIGIVKSLDCFPHCSALREVSLFKDISFIHHCWLCRHVWICLFIKVFRFFWWWTDWEKICSPCFLLNLFLSTLSLFLPFMDTILVCGLASLFQWKKSYTVYKTLSSNADVILCQCACRVKASALGRDYHKLRLTLGSQEESSRGENKQTK